MTDSPSGSSDDQALADLRRTLAADDYGMEVSREGTDVLVRITAGPQACADCLVPPPIMRGILGKALGVQEGSISLVYPAESELH
ncbi:hypothetical protein [Pseudonocardia humida]|uniref:Fe-S cluster biogenesis protein NfuA n=1 Tax=Pseudonocardia humida TaxID=2800819 RepID=A0ABT0ZZN4_9PSEU|nr:hypothetical protein [Pseudonocardia humida]MCO1656133.1 hypothetical protein [Pseudonocardia humida]